MAKPTSKFFCADCGAQFSKWQGQCDECGSWNRISEAPRSHAAGAGYAGAVTGATELVTLAQIKLTETPRISTGIGELDRVLGGGLVPGSAIVLGGHPGAGKSTLVLQALGNLGRQLPVLYVTGEESLQQVAMRAQRLGVVSDQLKLLAETRIETVIDCCVRHQPRVLVIDSIQVMQLAELQSAPGSVSQVRESAARLTRFAKESGTILLLVGHVTKEGHLAGPKVLEHMIDCSLMLEGSSDSRFRILRGQKNRFGAVNELGVFAMVENGLREVKNPSAIFLSGRREPSAGTLVTALWEGTRPLLVELQALVDQNHHGQPRRLAVGADLNRLALLLAILHRHGGLFLGDQDLFVNVVGGVKVEETSADLALVLALVSSFRNQPLPQDLLVFGEVGLAGEIRPVPSGLERLQEAAKHGFTRAIVPTANCPKQTIAGMTVIGVERVTDALESF